MDVCLMFSISEKCVPCSSEKRQALFGVCEKSYAGKQAPFLEKMASNAIRAELQKACW